MIGEGVEVYFFLCKSLKGSKFTDFPNKQCFTLVDMHLIFVLKNKLYLIHCVFNMSDSEI